MELIIIAAVIAYLAFHAGHAHANYRHGRARGHRRRAVPGSGLPARRRLNI